MPAELHDDRTPDPSLRIIVFEDLHTVRSRRYVLEIAFVPFDDGIQTKKLVAVDPSPDHRRCTYFLEFLESVQARRGVRHDPVVSMDELEICLVCFCKLSSNALNRAALS